MQQFPTTPVFMPGDPPVPAPFVMTAADVIRFTRIDSAGVTDPDLTLQRYRRLGWLRAVQVSRHLRYLLPDVIAFVHRLAEREGRA